MQYSTATAMLLALLPAFTLSLPTLAVCRDSLRAAQLLWWSDTGLVSSFLSEATSLTGQNLANKAGTALSFEKDELNQKAILDATFLNVSNPDPKIVAANNVLVTNGTFQYVVTGLTDLVKNGASYSPDEVAKIVNKISADRCNHVLPAIDAYLEAATALLQDIRPSAAIRPNNCP